MCALTRQQVRQIDRYAMDVLGVSGLVLMENAGRGAAEAIAEFLGGCAGRRVAIVAGGGNNGGDGFVIARHLRMAGAEVVVFLAAPRDSLTDDARANLTIIQRLGLTVELVGEAGQASKGNSGPAAAGRADGLADRLGAFGLVVDAIGGTGIRGALRGPTAELVEQVNAAGRPIVAVDIPTGLDCDTGTAEGPAIRAAMTVTFVDRKAGFDAPGAAEYTGQVRVAHIGIPAEQVRRLMEQR